MDEIVISHILCDTIPRARGSWVGAGVGVAIVEGVGSARSLKLKDISGSFSMSDSWSDAWSFVRSISESVIGDASRQGCVSIIVIRKIIFQNIFNL